MSGHKTSAKKGGTSKFYQHMREKGHSKFAISLIENVQVDDLDDLRKLEQRKIIELDTIRNGFNTNRAYSTVADKKADMVAYNISYYIANRDRINNRVATRAQSLPIIKCGVCDYSTAFKFDLKKHRFTTKHSRNVRSAVNTILASQ